MLDALRYLSAFARHGLRPLWRQRAGELTLADVLARRVRHSPDALALELRGTTLSYRELWRASGRALAELQRLGARPGDVVALVGRNSIAYVAALLGGARGGITLALVHPELSGEPLRQALAVAGARFALCEAELVGALKHAAPELPCAGFDADAREPFVGEPELTGGVGAVHDFALVYTSGTTGLPKACRLPHSRVLAAACLFGAPLFDFGPHDKLLCALPLYHGSPLMLGLGTCLVTGTPLLLERRFSASELMGVAAASAATALLYVGDLGRMLLATPPSSADSAHALRLAVGNGMAADVWPRFQERFGIAQVREFYAATESPVGILNLAGRVGSVGNLPYAWLFGLKLARLDAAGELLRDARGRLVECGPDEPGELLVRARRSGVGVYHGYVDPSATEARLVRDAFAPGDALFRTHDVLRRDRAGYYYFVERGGDSYRFRGENVSVTQVERELLAIAGVQEAVVTGVEVPGHDGRAGLAALVSDSGFEVVRLAALAERLPRSALPRFVRLLPQLPRTATLKLQRRALADEGFDPERCAGQIWLLDGTVYRKLDRETHRDLLSGNVRL
ncbi:MAG TPA: AMP-binding protein [Polyangiaceae bacterium]|nr:AMP-binding protein [Polyangiaceae bacterium]